MENFSSLLSAEIKRQQETINLIPSENYPSKKVLEGLSTIFATKYAEGYPGKRYYPGNEIADQVENRTRSLALKAFDLAPESWHVNVQAYSGSPANFALYSALLNPRDTILSLKLSSGGHLSHGHSVTFSGKLYRIINYDVAPDGFLDYDAIQAIAQKEKPRLIISGFTAYPRIVDFATIGKIAHGVQALHLADVSHIAGLIAGKVHPTPFPHTDAVMMTTHKTLRGPRGALIFVKKQFGEALDKAIFPGLQGGPHLNTIYAIGCAIEEVLKKTFALYAQQIVKNAHTLAQTLEKSGFTLVSGGTDTHLMLINVAKVGLGGFDAEKLLERSGIIANRNTIPGDKSPFYPSGIRIGTPAITSRGVKESGCKTIARFIERALVKKEDPSKIHTEVTRFITKFKIPTLG